jgi:hypothetical protein
MTVAATIVNDALQFCGVSSSIMPSDPDQHQRAFTTLKRLFDILPTESVYLEMRRPSTISADILEPGYATEPLVAILAKWVAPYFQTSVDPEHYENAIRLLRSKTRRKIETAYPDTLPVGSGNMEYSLSYFYPGQNQYQITQFDSAHAGEAKIYAFDFSSEATRRGTTVSSVTMSNIGFISVTISGEALSSSLKTCLVTFNDVGNALVRARCAFASGEIYDSVLECEVSDMAGALA